MQRCSSAGLVLALLIFAFTVGLGGEADAGCADGGVPFPSAESDGIGGTGRAPDDPDEGGVGGTGLTGEQPDDGIGGTGIRAEGDAAIVGTVTGFGSICVGGVEIHYDADTPISSDGRRIDASALAVGQVVEVVAQGGGDELKARLIGIHYVVRGPVASVDSVANRIAVLGQAVQLGPSTWTSTDTDVRQARAGDYQPGEFIEVSGLRRDDDVVMASYVARGDAGEGGVFLTGAVGEASGALLRVAGTNVELAAGESAAASSGTPVTVSGTWDGTTIRAAHVAMRPSIPFDAQVKRLDVEGYVREAGEGRGLLIGDQRVSLGSESADVKPGQRVRVEVVVSPDRQLIDGRIVPLRDLRPASPAARPLPRELPPGAVRRGAAREGGGQGAGAESSAPPDARRDVEHPGRDSNRSDGFEGQPPHDQSDRDRPERPDRIERSELPNRPDRPDRPERPDRPDRPERPDLPDRPQRPDLPDRPPRF